MSTVLKEARKSKHIFYFDALRALAIVSVVIIHVFLLTRTIVTANYFKLSFNWILTIFMGNPMRIGVDLFLMLSGALSLGRVWDIKSFLSKRLPRIIFPFLFWNSVMIIIYILLFHFFSFNFMDNFDYSSIFKFIFQVFNSKIKGFGHNWFFWMILGTYLIMPIFNRWLQHSNLKEVEYFLFFWLIYTLFDFTLNLNFPLKLSYFTSPIGFVILGYYLRHTKRKILNNPIFSFVSLCLLIVIIMGVVYYISSSQSMYFFHRYSFLILLEAASLFLLFKNFNKLNIKPHFKRVNKLLHGFISLLAKYSYGIYLMHYPIIIIFFKLLPIESMQFNILTTLLMVVGIFIPLIVLAIFNRVSYLNQIIGVK